jgi:hypothetical protein
MSYGSERDRWGMDPWPPCQIHSQTKYDMYCMTDISLIVPQLLTVFLLLSLPPPPHFYGLGPAPISFATQWKVSHSRGILGSGSWRKKRLDQGSRWEEADLSLSLFLIMWFKAKPSLMLSFVAYPRRFSQFFRFAKGIFPWPLHSEKQTF